MKNYLLLLVHLIATLLVSVMSGFSQEKSIQDLEFLTGTWKVREENKEKAWWEETTRTGQYVLDSTYIELVSRATSSSGKKRTYRWYIHHNAKTNQFEMVSMFSNWYKVQFDLLEWDAEKRILTIRNGGDPGDQGYHERLGEIVFDEEFTEYTWTGENKSGDPENPSIWKYMEKGTRIED